MRSHTHSYTHCPHTILLTPTLNTKHVPEKRTPAIRCHKELHPLCKCTKTSPYPVDVETVGAHNTGPCLVAMSSVPAMVETAQTSLLIKRYSPEYNGKKKEYCRSESLARDLCKENNGDFFYWSFWRYGMKYQLCSENMRPYDIRNSM